MWGPREQKVTPRMVWEQPSWLLQSQGSQEHEVQMQRAVLGLWIFLAPVRHIEVVKYKHHITLQSSSFASLMSAHHSWGLSLGWLLHSWGRAMS